MDPFSLAVGIAGLAASVGAVVKAAKAYLSSVNTAKESIQLLIDELEALESNLKRLDSFLRQTEVSVTFEHTSALRSCLISCDDKLKTLSDKLGQLSDHRRARFLWPLKEKDHQKTVQELRTFTQCISFALSVDGCALLSKTSKDVVHISEQQATSFRHLQGIEAEVADIKASINTQTQMLLDDRDEKLRFQILNWISTLEYDQKHNAVRLPRVAGTGAWLIERAEFTEWYDDAVSSSNGLWCVGNPGSGKSVLT